MPTARCASAAEPRRAAADRDRLRRGGAHDGGVREPAPRGHALPRLRLCRARNRRRQLRGAQTAEEDDWVQISAPEELADLQTKDILAEKEAVEREVEQLRRELGLQ